MQVEQRIRVACEKRGARGVRDEMGGEGEGIILQQEAEDKTPVSHEKMVDLLLSGRRSSWRFSFASLRQGLTLAQV